MTRSTGARAARTLVPCLLVVAALAAGLALAEDPATVARPADRPGVGQPIALERLVDIEGRAIPFDRPLVIAMTSTTCPLALKYAPTLARLSRRERVVWVDVHGADTVADLQRLAQEHGFQGALVHDPARAVARALGALSTTEVFVVDATRRLVYRGAVDDQYGIGTARAAPREPYLERALEDLRAGRTLRVGSTSAPGCALDFAPAPVGGSELTWHGEIQRIVQTNCQGCHRAGGIAPFGLERYEDVVANADMVSWAVRSGTMPPWFAAPGTGPWANDRTLPAKDKAALLAWLGGGRQKGDPAAAPAAPSWPETWSIGTPDAVIELPHEVEVKAEGTMPYVFVQAPTHFAEDRWIRAWEVIPGARDVVHHVLVFAVPPGGTLRDSEREGFFAAFVPGNQRAIYPAGLAKRLPQGATLHFQLHYTPNGMARRDRTRIGLVFDPAPRHEVHTVGISNPRIRIPPGVADHIERASVSLPYDVELLGLMPHMHYRGKAFDYELVDGDTRTLLLSVPRYDFNWQLAYWYGAPRPLAAGSRIDVTAHYDNSVGNAANPDPTVEVRWGPQSENEMLLGYIEYTVPGIALGEALPHVGATQPDRLLKLLDKDQNGTIERAECPRWALRRFDALDVDRNGKVDLAELRALEGAGSR